jgi:hypothetical protein
MTSGDASFHTMQDDRFAEMQFDSRTRQETPIGFDKRTAR